MKETRPSLCGVRGKRHAYKYGKLVLFPTTPRHAVFILTTRMSEVNTKQAGFIRLLPDLSSNTRKGHGIYGGTTKQITC